MPSSVTSHFHNIQGNKFRLHVQLKKGQQKSQRHILHFLKFHFLKGNQSSPSLVLSRTEKETKNKQACRLLVKKILRFLLISATSFLIK